MIFVVMKGLVLVAWGSEDRVQLFAGAFVDLHALLHGTVPRKVEKIMAFCLWIEEVSCTFLLALVMVITVLSDRKWSKIPSVP